MNGSKNIDFESLKVIGEPAETGTRRIYFEDKNGNEAFKNGTWNQGQFNVYGNYFVSIGRTECPECRFHKDEPRDCSCNGFGSETLEDLGRS